MRSELARFLDTAYSYQHDEFYPEHHEANLKKLGAEFPGYEKSLIDCLYQMAVDLDLRAQNFAKKIYHRYLTEKEALGRLAVTFHHFSKGTRDWALEHAMDQHPAR